MTLSDRHTRFVASLELAPPPHQHRPINQFAQQESLSDVVSTLPRSQFESTFTLIHQHASDLITRGEYMDGADGVTPARRKECLDALHAVYQLTTLFVQTSNDTKSKVLSGTLFQTIQLLHDALLTLPHPDGSHLQNCISIMCEKLYTKQYHVKATVAVPDVTNLTVNNLLPMTLSYLLLRSLETDTSSDAVGVSGSKDAQSGGKKNDVARLYAMRQGLTAFDYDDDSSDTIKQLLVRCMVHPLFLRQVEGRRFLSFILVGLGVGADRANVEMMRMLHAANKYQLPLAKASFIPLYADVYTRAWRLCCEGLPSQLQTFEEDVIQDLMHAAIHSAHPKTAAAIQALLAAAWHDPGQKKTPRVEEMLQRLYEPILWRAMKAANPLVRRHAVEIFIDVFPLVITDGGSSSSSFGSNDELLQYQFDCLTSLLSDPDLGIRVLGISGISKILASWWEMLPISVSKSLVLKIARDMVRDAGPGAAAVRVAVFQGIAYILDNVLSHPLLKIILPTLHESIFDASEAVQIAFIDMLHVIKKIKGITYYEVVSVDELMLAIQTNKSVKVVHKLLGLVLNSYFPPKKPIESIMTRCLTLLRSNPHVFTIMMYYLHQHTDIVSSERRIELVQGIYQCIVRNVQQQKSKLDSIGTDEKSKAKKSKASSSSAAASSTSDPLFLDLTDLTLFESLMSCLVVLFQNLEIDEDEDEAAIEQCFADGGLNLLLVTIGTKSASIRMSLIHLSALLPDSCSPALGEVSLPHLLSLHPIRAPVAEYGPIIECLVAWGRTEDLLEHIFTSLTLAIRVGTEEDGEGEDGEKEYFQCDANEVERRTRILREKIAETRQKILSDGVHSKPKRGKKSKGVNSSAAAIDPSLPALHPLLAAKFLAYLFEHEKPRHALLESAVVWELTDQSDPSQAKETGGRVQGYLAQIMSLLHERALPSIKDLFDTKLGGALTPAERMRANFLSAIQQVQMKVELHAHARLKLLAQRANDLARERAEEAAMAASRAQAAAENADGDVSMSFSPVVVAPPVISHIELFPRSFEQTMDFMAYIAMPMWGIVMDRNDSKQQQHATSEKKEEDQEDDDDKNSTTRVNKKSKKKHHRVNDDDDNHTNSLPLTTLSSFFHTFLAFNLRYATDLLSVGYFHTSCPMRQMMDILNVLHAEQSRSSATSNGDGAADGVSDLASTTIFGSESIACLDELIPILFKFVCHLSTIAGVTIGFGSAQDLTTIHTDSEKINFYTWNSFLQSLLRLITIDTNVSHLDALLSTNTYVRTCIPEVLKTFQSSSRILPRVLWTFVESLVNVDRYGARCLGVEPITSTADLAPWPLLLLTSIAKNPTALFALPKMIQHAMTEETNTNEETRQRIGTAISALANMAEIHVKMEKKRHTFLSTLLSCTRLLSTPSNDVPLAHASAASASATSAAALSPALAAAPSDACGVAPMEIDLTPIKPSRATDKQKDEKENQTPNKINADTGHPISATRLKRAAGSPTAAVQYDHPLWRQLQDAITSKMNRLQV